VVCAVVVLLESAHRAYRVLVLGKYTRAGKKISVTESDFAPPEYGEA
jgi:hypothetical protein